MKTMKIMPIEELNSIILLNDEVVLKPFHKDEVVQFDALEVDPMKFVDDIWEPCEEDDTPDFYSIFAHMKEGGRMSVADCKTKETAEMLVKIITELIQKWVK